MIHLPQIIRSVWQVVQVCKQLITVFQSQAPLQVPGMKMRNLPFGVILGLLAFVHSTPLDTLTQDDIYREAMTDGFLLDNPSGTSPTTESPIRNATVQASKQPSPVLEDNKMVYDSDLGDTNDNSMTSDDFSSDQSSTQSPQSDFTSSSVSTKAKPSISPDHISSFQSTDPNLSIADSSDHSESGSKMEVTDLPTAKTVEPESNHLQPNAESSTESSVFTTAPKKDPEIIAGNEESQPGWESEFGSGSPETELKFTTESSTESSIFTTALKKDPESTAVNEDSWRGLEGELGSGSPDTENSETEIISTTESSTDSSIFTTALKKDPEIIAVNEDSWRGLGGEFGSGSPDTEISETEKKSTTGTESERTYPAYINKNVVLSIFNAESSTESSIFTTALKKDPEIIAKKGGSRLGLLPGFRPGSLDTQRDSGKAPEQQKVSENLESAEPQNAGHSTPGWMIIVGFVVGVAALVMICVAIATRDKWNGPRQESQLQTKTNTTNQQRELEMETFLSKDSPRENGKAAEYTVIPLDEFPEKYPSH